MGILEKISDEPRKNIRDYIMLMLGAPVLKIELDEQQVDLVIKEAAKYVDVFAHKNYTDEQRVILVQEGALIFAKTILGRIRSKYELPGTDKNKLDGKQLIQEAIKEKCFWEETVAKCPNSDSKNG